MATLRERLALLEEEILLADGLDEAFIGIGRRCGQPAVAIYSRQRCLDLLTQRDRLSLDEAREHFEFNIIGGWVGPQTPMFVEEAPTEDEA